MVWFFRTVFICYGFELTSRETYAKYFIRLITCAMENKNVVFLLFLCCTVYEQMDVIVTLASIQH